MIWSWFRRVILRRESRPYTVAEASARLAEAMKLAEERVAADLIRGIYGDHA